MMPVSLFTRVLYHGTKTARHGRATVILRVPEWPAGVPGSSDDGFRYVLKTPQGHLSHVRRQSFHTLREINNA